MTDADKRQFVADMYPGPGWKAQVGIMSDAQVYAIWLKEQQKQEKRQQDPKPKDNEDDIPF